MLREKFDLKGKTALVTGSARGIGKAIALGLAEYGARVIVHGVRPKGPHIDATLEEVKTLSPASFAKAFDLGNPAAIETAFAELAAEGIHPDILVCNASVQKPCKWYEVSRQDMIDQMQVNFNATFRMFQLCYPAMKERKWGRLIVVGSVQERRPHPDMTVYSASKSAQENLVRSIARQVAPEGITVNNLCPGVFLTDRNQAAYADPVYGPKVTAAIPMHDWALPEDAAGTAVLLASDAGRYITGATIMVDGGISLPG